MHVDLAKEQVLVETALTSLQVQSLIESTGRRAVLKGMGGSETGETSDAVSVTAGNRPNVSHPCVCIRPRCCRGDDQWGGASAGRGQIPAAVTGPLFD